MPPTAGEAAAAVDRRNAVRIHDASAMILAWFRLACPTVLDASGHRLRRSVEPLPVDKLVDILADGVVLADYVSSMDSTKLAPTSIMRASGRNALSAPAQSSRASPNETAKNIDSRQREVQYRTNTRRVVTALKKIFDAVRDDTPQGAHVPGAVQNYVGDVASISPLKDLRPALKLAELVVAASVYGPAKEAHRDLFWELPTDAMRRAFHKSMTSVSQALYLPPPDTLYADGPSDSPVISPPPQDGGGKQKKVLEEQVVELSRTHAQEAYAPPLVDEATKTDAMDDGMGGRKFSMVTEDGNVSRDGNSPRPDETSGVESSRPFSPERDLAIGKPATERVADSNAGRSARTREAEVDIHSKTASEEFFTPREHTPRERSPSPVSSRKNNTQIGSSSYRAARVAGQVEDSHIDDHPATGMARLESHRMQPTPQDVDENVRQSVSTSIAKQISQVPTFEVSESHGTYTSTEGPSFDHGSGVFGEQEAHAYEEDSGAVNFMDPAFMISPSGSDVPSPSNQWQIYRQKALAAEISSPQPLYSPPRMPKRLARTATATQMTPPPRMSLLGLHSPQLSVSSTGAEGADHVPDIDSPNEASRNPRVSFASHIISPGGNEHPLGKPLKRTEEQREGGAGRKQSKDGSFSLPPCAAASRGAGSSSTEELSGERRTRSKVRREVSSPTLAPEDEEEDASQIPQHVTRLPGSVSHEKSGSVAELLQKYEAKELESKEGYVHAGHSFADEPSPLAEQVVHASPKQSITTDEEYWKSEEQEHTKEVARLSSPKLSAGEDDGDIFAEIEALKAANPDITFLSQGERPVSPPPGYPGRPMIPRPEDREVPPTPPSPPTLAALVDSFTEGRESNRPVEARPVSTMAPSAGLFQRLINVWQSAEEGEEIDLHTEQREMDKGQTSQVSGTEVSRSMSTQESTLPSGDTDMNLGTVAKQEETSKTRRPRAIRIPSGTPTKEDIRKFGLPGSGGSDMDETESIASKGSVASFSDAFSSDRDRNWLYSGEAMADQDDWEAAMKGDDLAGIPLAPRVNEVKRSRHQKDSHASSKKQSAPGREKPPLPPSPSPKSGTRKVKSHSTSTAGNSVAMDGQHIKVDRRRLDWLTRELLKARDVIARQELQMTFAETQRVEQEEILLLDKHNAESVVSAMKEILGEREKELKEARDRLSVAIQSVSHDRSSHGSRTSTSGQGEDLAKLIADGNEKLHARMEVSEGKSRDVADEMRREAQGLWTEVKKAMIEKMAEMNEKRDAELEILKAELDHRQYLIDDLQKSSKDLRSKNESYQTDLHAMRLDKEKSVHKYQLEMAHVTAQVELVNEFSKKLHDNFRETENLRQQVLQYQDKLSHITSTSGISQRQIKELREAVTRANDECARWRREAEMEKRKGMEAERRAEELEELRHKDAQANASRFPDRTESGSIRSAEQVRSPRSGSANGSRYGPPRSRHVPPGHTPAQKAWLVIKDKIGGIVTGKEGGSSRRRTGHNGRRDASRGSGSRSSGNSRSRYSRDDDLVRRSRSESLRSRSSNGSGSSARSGTQRSGESGRRGSPSADVQQFLHDSPKMAPEASRFRAADF